jgi:hypothetical protein
MRRDVASDLAKLFEGGRREAACGLDQIVSQDWYPHNP